MHVVSMYVFFDDLNVAWTVGDRDVEHIHSNTDRYFSVFHHGFYALDFDIISSFSYAASYTKNHAALDSSLFDNVTEIHFVITLFL